VKRAVAAVALVLVALGALVAFGPARLRPWDCRESASASTAPAAVNAFYDSCSDPPGSVTPLVVTRGPGRGVQTPNGDSFTDLQDFSVRYDDGRVKFLLVGRHEPDGAWRVIQGEGTGP